MAIDAVNAAGLAQGPALLLGHCFFGFGRKAALESSDNSYYRSLSNVRCYPESRHVQRTSRCPLCANSVQTVMPASRPSCSSLNDHSWNGWSCFWLIQSFKRATMKHPLREIHICCAQYLRSELQV